MYVAYLGISNYLVGVTGHEHNWKGKSYAHRQRIWKQPRPHLATILDYLRYTSSYPFEEIFRLILL
jgi:hypothetical protein